MLRVGDKAPEFTLLDQDENEVSLSDYKNQKVVIWFFPKASTPGWTNEGIGFRDELEKFNNQNTVIIGVSADSPSRQKKFVEKYSFNYPMLFDESHNMLTAYKVWALKKFMGREYMGILRVTYIINGDGKIIKVYDQVKTKTHSQDVLSDCA